jgi:hypothetical protein
MRRKLLMKIPVLLVFFPLFTACEQPDALSSDATVSSVSIGGVQAQSLGTPSANWMAVVPGDIYLSHSQLANTQVSVNADSGAKIYYAKGADGAQPYFVEDSTLSLEHDDLVWIEVFSANLDEYLLYAIKVHKRTPVLSGITLAYQYPGQDYSVTHSYGLNLGTPGVSLDDPALVSGEIWYGKTQAGSDLTVVAQPEMDDSVVVVSGSDNFDTPVTVTAANGSYFYIRSTSGLEEEGEIIYYKIKLVEKNDDLSLTGNKVSINGVDATAGRMGAHSLVGQEAWGNFNDGAVLDAAGYVSINTTLETANAPVTVNVGLTDSTGVTVEYGHTSNDREYLIDDENWTADPNLNILPTNEYVVLRLTSELGVRGWYKFRVRIGRTGNSLASITIDNSQIDSVPASNAYVTGTTAVNHTMSAAGPWTVSVSAAPLTTSSGGARIAYAVASEGNTDTPAANFSDTGSFSNVALGHYVVIRVVSENGENTGYYKVRLVFGDAIDTLSAITINNAAIETVPDPNVTADGANAGRHQMSVAGPWASVTVGVTKGSEKATVAYASAPAVNASIADAAWSDSGTLSNIQSGQYVFIRVTSEAGTVNYYKIRLVYGSSEAALSSVIVGGVSASLSLAGIFDPAMGGAYTGSAGTVTLTPEQAGDGSAVTVAATASSGATVRYNWGGGMEFYGMTFYYLSEAAWNTTGAGLFGGGSFFYGMINVPSGVNGALIFIEVTSQDGTAVNTYAVSCAVSE